MRCLQCEIEMECYNDVNDVGARIDWERCPNCGAESTIVYNVNTLNVIHSSWKQTRDNGVLTIQWDSKRDI